MPLSFAHFPDRLHAYVWRNWTLVPLDRVARVVGAQPAQIVRLGHAMGLSGPPRISRDQQRRSYITVIRRNWHLLPYQQLLELLDWSPDKMAFTLREDDFLFEKLGNLKPQCEPLRYASSSADVMAREEQIARIVRQEFPDGLGQTPDPLFGFVERLSRQPARPKLEISKFSPRFCYSYFALYGDPLLETEADPYPAGYLRQLAAAGVDGVWLQAVLQKLAPFPWLPKASARYEERLANLRRLVARARSEGIGVYLYLNEPRAMPVSFYESHPELKGVTEGDHATLCTSHPAVQRWLVEAVSSIARAVPELAGFFTITASENLSNCWSHNGGAKCPRCSRRSPSAVIAEVNGLFYQGIQQSGSRARLLAWDWGWADDWAEGIINQLPKEVSLLSVSEWSLPIQRGGIETRVGEYSISSIGPGPRAQKHWQLARQRGLKTIAKIQAGNTWELSAVPYIPALENVARHAANLFRANVDGLMLGWTLGGYPSPNLEVVAEVARYQKVPGSIPSGADETSMMATEAMQAVARRRFGQALAPAVVQAWHEFSSAFSQFPFDGGVVYNAPMQYGPSNLLWEKPTTYRATMIGFPYDDLDGWRGPYPADVFIGQFAKVSAGFEAAVQQLQAAFAAQRERLTREQRQNIVGELSVAEAAAIHFRTTANQARFVQARHRLAAAKDATDEKSCQAELERLLHSEAGLARRLYAVQGRDSRIGFEASNQYYYVPLDLAEKVLNCHDLRERWLASLASPRR